MYPDWFSDEFRGCGRTTDQMLGAPEGAIYIVAREPEVWYAQNLLRYLQRPDLIIKTIGYATGESWRGRRLTGVVVDHYVKRGYPLSHRELCALAQLRMCARA